MGLILQSELNPHVSLAWILEYTPPAGSDFDLYIYDQAKALVAKSENDVGLVEDISATNKAASAGTFWIHVKYYSGASKTNPYKLKLTF